MIPDPGQVEKLARDNQRLAHHLTQSRMIGFAAVVAANIGVLSWVIRLILALPTEETTCAGCAKLRAFMLEGTTEPPADEEPPPPPLAVVQ